MSQEDEIENKFYLVWRYPVNRMENLPSKAHETEIEAVEEAKRLAASHPGSTFYVAQTLFKTKISKVDIIKLI